MRQNYKNMNNNSNNKNLLIDKFNRPIKYLRISVTDKCNMRCFYCLPKDYRDFTVPERRLNFIQIEKIVNAFANLGVQSVRLTGGEPLVRAGICDLVRTIKNNKNITDLSMSTNASLLIDKAYDLKQAGLDRLNVSLDSMNPKTFHDITCGFKLSDTLNGLEVAKKEGITPIKINMVIMRGINDNDIDNMIEYCMENKFVLRLIEAMPVGIGGRKARDYYINLNEVIDDLKQKYNLIKTEFMGSGPAKYYKIMDTNFKIGFITPISQHFCDACNRVRLSVDGMLYLCLGEDNKVDLRRHLMQNISDDGLEQIIKDAILKKPEKHTFSKESTTYRPMSFTGG